MAARTKRSIHLLKDGSIVSDERHQRSGVPHADTYKLSVTESVSRLSVVLVCQPRQLLAMFSVWLRTLQLSVKSLWMHPLRSSLTVLGIFIGVSSVIWLLAIGRRDQPGGPGADRQPRRAQHHRPHDQAVGRRGAGRRLRTDAGRLRAAGGHGADDLQGDSDAHHSGGRVSQSEPQDRRPARRHHARLRRGHAARGRSRPVSVRHRCRRTSATTACWRPRWPTSCFPIGEPIGQQVMVDEQFYQGRRRDEAADRRRPALAVRWRPRAFRATSTCRSRRSGGAKGT